MIRNATEGDHAAIEALAYAIWGDDTEAMAKRPPGWNRRRWTVDRHMDPAGKPRPTTLVWEVGGRVVAAGTVGFREREPRNRISIHVAPGFRDRGIGTALFRALDAAHRAGPYLARELGDPEAVAMYEALGFHAVERVTEGWIDPAKPSTAAWIDAVEAAPRSDLDLVPLGERGAPTPVEVARLYDRSYRRQHAYLPDGERSDAAVLDFFLGTGFFSSPAITTHCALVRGRFVGGATLHPPAFGEADPGSAHLVAVHVDPPDLTAAESVVTSLVARVLDTARREGLRVQAEACDINPLFEACIDAIPGTDLERGLTVLIDDPT